jgi:SAM-dependent methyltransferase
MQTSIIRQRRISLTAQTAQDAGLVRSASVKLTPADDRLVVEPADEGTAMQELQIPLPEDLMSSLGWASGDVVGVEAANGGLVARRLADPLAPELTSTGADGLPVPPHWLIQTVSPGPGLKRFVDGGQRAAQLFGRLIGERLPAEPRPRVMDFGCGCGRVARALPQHVSCELTGCDLIEAAVQWCRLNLEGEFLVSSENPPLPLPDERFDALYAVSVLTHLDEAHQDAWLAEWRRLIRPGGLALVTYRGEGFLAKAESAEAASSPDAGARRRRIEGLWGETGFGFTTTDFWEGLFPAFYGGAYHRDAYVRSHWSGFLEICDLLHATDTGLVQDLAVMRRR